MSETLRLEIAPFGVKVITVMAGTVGTNFQNNNVTASVAQESMYKAAGSKIADSAAGKLLPKAMDANVFAEQLVKDVLKGHSGLLWRGNHASVVKWMANWLPTNVMVSEGMLGLLR